jgi:hypothetical protein
LSSLFLLGEGIHACNIPEFLVLFEKYSSLDFKLGDGSTDALATTTPHV